MGGEIGLDAEDLVSGEVWRLRRAGVSRVGIARLTGLPASRVVVMLRRRGGIAPQERQRRAGALSGAERERIALGLGARESFRSLSRMLGRSGTTISREVVRNGGRSGHGVLEAEARDQARRPRPCKQAANPGLAEAVAGKLAQRRSPQQLSGWLKRDHAREAAIQVSHETICQTLFIQARGAQKAKLLDHLRRAR